MNMKDFLMTVAAGLAVFLIARQFGKPKPSVSYTDSFGDSYGQVTSEQAAMLADQDRAFANWDQPATNPARFWL